MQQSYHSGKNTDQFSTSNMLSTVPDQNRQPQQYSNTTQLVGGPPVFDYRHNAQSVMSSKPPVFPTPQTAMSSQPPVFPTPQSASSKPNSGISRIRSIDEGMFYQ